jgi:hypothetical protein
MVQTKPRPDRMNERTVSWYLNRVFAPYPEYFGKSTKAQRDTWSEQLRWAMTIVTSRAFAPRFPGDPPLFVILVVHSTGRIYLDWEDLLAVCVPFSLLMRLYRGRYYVDSWHRHIES